MTYVCTICQSIEQETPEDGGGLKDAAVKHQEFLSMCAQRASLNTHNHMHLRSGVCVCSPSHTHTQLHSTQLGLMTKSITRIHCLLVVLYAFLFITQVQFPKLLKLNQRFLGICIQQGHLSLHPHNSPPQDVSFLLHCQ